LPLASPARGFFIATLIDRKQNWKIFYVPGLVIGEIPMGWDFPRQKRVFYLIDICVEMIKYGLKLNVAKLQHYVFNHVTTRSHEG
jgi:hypothetical protein